MKILYGCDGEYSAIMELDDLIDNFLASEAEVDVTAMRSYVEDHGWYTAVHDNGAFLVLNLDRFAKLLTLTPEAMDLFHDKGQAMETVL
jgi:hypothetical protein